MESKILFLYPKYIYNSDKYIDCEYDRIWYHTVRHLGFNDCEVLYTDDLFKETLQGINFLRTIEERIEEFNPDIIFLDLNFHGSKMLLNQEFLKKIKEKYSVRLIGFIGDAWGDWGVEVVQYWSPAVDILLYGAPPEERHEPLISNLGNSYLIPLLVNPIAFHDERPKALDLYFSGSIETGLRPFWIPVLKKLVDKKRFNAVINCHHRQRGVAYDHDLYEKYTRTSKIIVNFSSRSYSPRPIKALTGRAWQAIASGALLLEEDNESIKGYFSPYLHYVPFKSVHDLESFIEFFLVEDDYRERVASGGLRHYEENYSCERVWEKILKRCYSS